MQVILIGIGLLILILIIKTFSGKPDQEQINPKRALLKLNTDHETINDKLIIVNNAKHEDVRKAILAFSKMSNEGDLTVVSRLFKISETASAITFPYDVSFEQLCYLVNYLKYPTDINYDAEVTGWAGTRQTDQWITEKLVGKAVMLYLSDEDTEYDNVFMTTSDNTGYKLGFAVGEETQILDRPQKQYSPPPISKQELTGKTSEDLR